jgi:hypothetical protein
MNVDAMIGSETQNSLVKSTSLLLDSFSCPENYFPQDCIDDAIVVWNFFNTFK